MKTPEENLKEKVRQVVQMGCRLHCHLDRESRTVHFQYEMPEGADADTEALAFVRLGRWWRRWTPFTSILVATG